ncbi:MAG: preprotein translocase subunit SecG [Candidatus Gastranaerophilales bacterium]|nr:preprotein translocase subunit SecG [Candidatus Gastranaerophilales bacterium]
MITKAFYVAQIVSAFLSVFFILLHSPKGDGMASIGAASQLFTSQKTAEKDLNRITYFFVGVFVISSFMLGFILK